MKIEIGQYVEEEKEVSLLPEGAYYFTVLDYETEEYSSAKIDPCTRVLLSLNISYNNSNYTLKTGLILDSALIWKTTDFFKSIGRKPQNGKYQIDFNGIIGKSGLALIHRKEGRDGRMYTNVDQFLAGPEDPKLKGATIINLPDGLDSLDPDGFEEIPF